MVGLSVVIPLYCEEAIVDKTITAVDQALDSLKEQYDYEVILVDDGSADDTWRVIERAAKSYPAIRAIRLSRNFGKEAALCAGLEMAKGKAVIIMDGDLQHPPSLIPEMVRVWHEQGADIVEAIKEERGKESLPSRLNAYVFYTLFDKLTGYDLRRSSDFILMDRQVVDAWSQLKERNIFFRGVTKWIGFKHVQVPFRVNERLTGKSGWSMYRLVKLALTAVTSFSSSPLHIVTLCGICFALFALVLGIQTLYLKLTGSALEGFTTVILLLLIIGSILMFALGIIGEYLARIYEEVKARPRYIISKIIDSR